MDVKTHWNEWRHGCVRCLQVTMADRAAAERACKEPNPVIDGRKANVNLAYLGAKPRGIQTGRVLQVYYRAYLYSMVLRAL